MGVRNTTLCNYLHPCWNAAAVVDNRDIPKSSNGTLAKNRTGSPFLPDSVNRDKMKKDSVCDNQPVRMARKNAGLYIVACLLHFQG